MRPLARLAMLVVLATLVPARPLAAQRSVDGIDPRSPLWVATMFYGAPAFPDLARFITGEHAQHHADAGTVGDGLPASVVVTSRVLQADSARAIVATALRDSARAVDFYTYLVWSESRWKISAVRRLALPGFFETLVDSLRAQRARGMLADSLRPRFERMELTAQSDSVLRAHLLAHRGSLEAIARQLLSQPGLLAVHEDGRVQPDSALRGAPLLAMTRAMRDAAIGVVEREELHPGCVFLTVGGILDNRVGFLYAPAGCTPPDMDPSEYIYVERVAPGWYVFKTT